MSSLSRIIAGGLVGLGVAAGGLLAGQSLVESRLGYRVVTVKGLSEREVKANLGFWPIRFVTTGATLEQARSQLEVSERAVKGFLGTNGFTEQDMTVQNIQVEDRMAGYNAQGTPPESRFVLTEDFLVRSTEVDKLQASARMIGDLLKSGVVFSADAYNAGPSFVFTQVNDLKGDMLTEATKRAKEAAEKFAAESGAKVGDIQSANQGVIEITPAIEIPNDRPEKQVMKKVRVVTTITYFLKE
ncbi:MAG: SIMPL domain-containing protein [Proteobacteria bacterium]|nr:SIMPL domain-containing protein [Pseudomonadota bacterium]